MRLLVSAAFLALALPSAGQAASAEAEAAAAVDAFHAALARGDTSAAAALLAEDALIFESGGVEHGKAEYAAHHLPADAAFSKAIPAKMVRRSARVDGPLAWVASEGRVAGTYKGKPINSATTETMVLRRGDGGWKIVHVHWSSGRAAD